jgi:hypothetical protein
MEEVEVPLEQVQEQVEHAHESQEGHSGSHTGHGKTGWVTWAALLSAILAVLAAISALLAGSRVNEAMMDQMKASDQWGYYQAKGIKSAILETRAELLDAQTEAGKAVQEKIEKYADDQSEIQEKAEDFEKRSEENFHQHEAFAHGVTFFQIAIAVTAIAVLAKRRRFLFASAAFGVVGIFFLIQGIIVKFTV